MSFYFESYKSAEKDGYPWGWYMKEIKLAELMKVITEKEVQQGGLKNEGTPLTDLDPEISFLVEAVGLGKATMIGVEQVSSDLAIGMIKLASFPTKYKYPGQWKNFMRREIPEDTWEGYVDYLHREGDIKEPDEVLVAIAKVVFTAGTEYSVNRPDFRHLDEERKLVMVKPS